MCYFASIATYLHTTSTSAFTIFFAIKQTNYHLTSTIIDRLSVFEYVIYSSGAAHFQQCASSKEYITVKKANSSNNGAIEMKIGLLNGGEDREDTGVWCEISYVFVMHSEFFYRVPPFDKIYLPVQLSKFTLRILVNARGKINNCPI